MPSISRDRRLFALPFAFVALGLLTYGVHVAAAQPATGSISGRVLWGSCVRIPLPMDSTQPNGVGTSQPDASSSTQPGAPTTSPDSQPPGPASRPIQQVRALPAGAVLVAVQNTALSARTDEAGKFSLSGVPAGQYLTVAAGPVANSMDAIAQRPNVLVNGGQTTDVGTLVLGGTSPMGFACRPLQPGVESPGAAPSDTTSPPDSNTP